MFAFSGATNAARLERCCKPFYDTRYLSLSSTSKTSSLTDGTSSATDLSHLNLFFPDFSQFLLARWRTQHSTFDPPSWQSCCNPDTFLATVSWVEATGNSVLSFSESLRSCSSGFQSWRSEPFHVQQRSPDQDLKITRVVPWTVGAPLAVRRSDGFISSSEMPTLLTMADTDIALLQCLPCRCLWQTTQNGQAIPTQRAKAGGGPGPFSWALIVATACETIRPFQSLQLHWGPQNGEQDWSPVTG